MCKVFYDMGILTKADVVDRVLRRPKGTKDAKDSWECIGVLFIGEAHRLVGEGFAKEAMDEIVDCLTKLKYAQKLSVILAGHDVDINYLI